MFTKTWLTESDPDSDLVNSGFGALDHLDQYREVMEKTWGGGVYKLKTQNFSDREGAYTVCTPDVDL